MKQILVVGEDPLTCALGEQLVAELLSDWGMPLAPINMKGVTKLIPELPRFIEQARHIQPVLCIADTDGKCAKTLLGGWLPRVVPRDFCLRLAVSEAESWLIADRQALADYFGIPEKHVSKTPDEEADPKRHMLNLARKSTVRDLRLEVVSQTDASKQGTGYNPHLCHFVKTHWSAQRASDNSPSLARAVRRIAKLIKAHDLNLAVEPQ
jgi:hypothetical protein